MRQALNLHPDSRNRAVTRIEADVARPRPGALHVRYVVMGNIGELRIPPVTESARRDELWQHTCFEAFIGAAASTAYCEFNFAPSTQWAAYCFDGYRRGMRVADEIGTPRMDVRVDDGCFVLNAALQLDRVPGLAGDAIWRVGLSAVIEDADGRKSYWALAHPPGQPDFHHSDCFALELPPA